MSVSAVIKCFVPFFSSSNVSTYFFPPLKCKPRYCALRSGYPLRCCRWGNHYPQRSYQANSVHKIRVVGLKYDGGQNVCKSCCISIVGDQYISFVRSFSISSISCCVRSVAIAIISATSFDFSEHMVHIRLTAPSICSSSKIRSRSISRRLIIASRPSWRGYR